MSKGRSTKESVNSQTIALKVNVCCKGCQKKIARTLLKIHGVEDVTLEAEENKVIVTGETDSATLVKKLRKVGKRAELWGVEEKKVIVTGETNSATLVAKLRKLGKRLRLRNLKRKEKLQDDEKASHPAAADEAEDDDSDGHEEEAVPEENRSSSPAVHGGSPTETMMMGGGGNPYHYGYQHDQHMQSPWAMQQEQNRRMRMMMEERERYGCPPPAHWYGRPEAQGYGQQYDKYESPENCSVM